MSERALPKGILLDVDMTMIGKNKEVSPRLAAAIEKIQTQLGIIVAVATGRTFPMLNAYIFSFFPADVLHVVAGGGQIISGAGAVVWQQQIPSHLVQSIAKWTQEHAGEFGFAKGSTYYATPHMKKRLEGSPWRFPISDPSSVADWTVPLLTIGSLKNDPTQQLPNKEALEIKYVLGNNGYFADITVHGVNKASTAQKWANQYGFSLEDVMAVGDSPNDVDLLQAVGWPVAMGNALPELKELAATVIGSVESDGLAIFLESLAAVNTSKK